MLALGGHGILGNLLLPPGSLFVLAGVGWIVRRRWRKVGHALIAAAVVLLWLLSTPLVGTALLISLQSEPALDPARLPPGPQAIVVLGADQRADAPELGGATVSQLTLERVRYAAFLAKRTGLPVLTSGGILKPVKTPIAELMKRVLERELDVAVRWTEDRSLDTRENALCSAELLRAQKIDRIFLVTHAWHMPRAKAAFERAGLLAVPAPTAFRTRDGFEPVDFLPSSRALNDSALAIHEWLGRAWYSIRGPRATR